MIKAYRELAKEIVELLDENCGITATTLANYCHYDRSVIEMMCEQMVKDNKMKKVVDDGINLYFSL